VNRGYQHMGVALVRRSVIPGFGLSLGCTVLYLSLIVLIPLSALFLKTAGLSWDAFWHGVSAPRVVASLQLTFGAALVAALINVVFGVLLAWILVRYSFPGRRLADALVDLPFALPTAVAGIALTTIYAPGGWIGGLFAPDGAIGSLIRTTVHDPVTGAETIERGLKIAYTPLGITIALTFIGLPFVVRTVQPILQDLHREVEEAAASLGANRWQVFTRIILPELWPAIITGFSLAFARAVGEYGSVVFIAGNRPGKTEIAPLLIITKLDQYDYTGATALATVMLVISFALLLAINLLQRWLGRR